MNANHVNGKKGLFLSQMCCDPGLEHRFRLPQAAYPDGEVFIATWSFHSYRPAENHGIFKYFGFGNLRLVGLRIIGYS